MISRALFITTIAAMTTCCAIGEGADKVRFGAWNIEWLGKPENRRGTGEDLAQTKDNLAKYIAASGVSVLALEEICDDGNSSTMRNQTPDK
ncbi:hypothetical protein SH501x_004532 [Pirellulaceae bacterium SH501]